MISLSKARNYKKILWIALFTYLILFVVISLFGNGIGGKRFILNTTDSLPGYLYLLDENSKDLKKGNVVAAVVPENIFKSNRNFLKQIWGMPGDKVTFDASGDFSINGSVKGTAKKFSSGSYTPLTHAKSGIIEDDHYFLATPHKDSYDSRYIYIGNIHEKNIIGNASLIF